MNVRLQYPFKFTAGIWYDGQLKMNNYDVRLWLLTNSVEPDSHNIALERVKYFIHGRLDSSILISDKNIDQIQHLHSIGLKLTSFPSEPVDQIIGIMLYSKLSAIMEGRMILGEVEITSELGGGVVYMHNEEENLGPFELGGWWNDADLTQCDSNLISEGKIMSLAKSKVWRELELNWPEDDTVNSSDSGNTIIFTDFNRNDTK
jgi:hypothetical protein